MRLATLIMALPILQTQAGVILEENFNYPDGGIVTNSASKWVTHSAGTGGTNTMLVSNGELEIRFSRFEDVSAQLIASPYNAATPIAALYAKFTVNFSALPSATGAYFAHFKDGGTSNFRARVFATVTGAASGAFRLGVANVGNSFTALPTDLQLNTPYTVVVRYVLATGLSTIWVNPTSEDTTGVVATDTPNTSIAISTYALRQASGEGDLNLDNLVVGTSFADVLPASAGSNPPFISVQPVGGNVGEGANVTFSVTAGGDTPAYQWRKGSSAISGATTSSYNIPSAVVANSGDYDVVVTNAAGSVTSSVANLTVSAVVVGPTITNQPKSQSVAYGGSVQLSVGASGTDPLYYQWTFHGTNLPGGTAAFYTINNAGPQHAGPYQVTVTNSAGSAVSEVANISVVPPAVTNIAYLRSTMDPVNYVPTNTTSLFTAEGIVVSHANLTSGTGLLFYMQDATAGMGVFWTGGSILLPQAGDRVRVTAPLASFNGLFQFGGNTNNPLHSITVISSNNPLPAPTPVPFDFFSQNDPATMEALEGKYVVASNVFLNLGSQLFVSVSAGEYLTNNLGETFLMYINNYTDIPGQTKPTGLVSVLGVMGQFDTSNPRTSNYQLIPTRYADIISQAKAATVRFTNYISQLRPSGLSVNTFTENVLRPGETLTMPVEVSDPDGGSVTITPLTGGLPASASWTTGVTSGTLVKAQFAFAPTSGEAGMSFTNRLRTVTSTATSTNSWIIYVPTAAEQQVFISEFLANPSADTNSPFYNPLKRTEMPTSNITVADEYVEIANLSGTDFDLFGWTIADTVGIRHRFYNGSPGETLFGNSAIVVYGGPLSGFAPVLSVPAFPASEGSAGLALNNSGTETITLRNAASNIVDRILYTGADVSGAGSLTRFPGPAGTSILVPQAYVGPVPTSAGTQYDGTAWGSTAAVPAPVSGVIAHGNPVTISFMAVPGKIYTLWQADTLPGPFEPVAGQQFQTSAGVFSVTNAPAGQQFYSITGQ